MAEVFRDVLDFSKYEISNTGKLRNKRTGKFIKGKFDKDGYIQVGLYHKEGEIEHKRKDFRMHRLVAVAFIPNPNNKPLVDHIDGNKANNNVDNLRWASFSENVYNTKKHRKSATNVKGIYFENDKYRVRVGIDGKQLSLGSFNTLDEAIEVRLKKVKEVFKDFVHKDEGKVIVC
eukprot:gene6072-6529_t